MRSGPSTARSPEPIQNAASAKIPGHDHRASSAGAVVPVRSMNSTKPAWTQLMGKRGWASSRTVMPCNIRTSSTSWVPSSQEQRRLIESVPMKAMTSMPRPAMVDTGNTETRPKPVIASRSTLRSGARYNATAPAVTRHCTATDTAWLCAGDSCTAAGSMDGCFAPCTSGHSSAAISCWVIGPRSSPRPSPAGRQQAPRCGATREAF